MSTEATAQDLSYPTGKFDKATVDPGRRREYIGTIKELPPMIASAVRGLDDKQLDTEYRPGGWTVRQTVHHVADSHLNSIIRCRLALTEAEPAIRAYDQALWADLPDMR